MDAPVDDDVMYVVLALVQSTHHGDTDGQAQLLASLDHRLLVQVIGSLIAMGHSLIECLAERYGTTYDDALVSFFEPELRP